MWSSTPIKSTSARLLRSAVQRQLVQPISAHASYRFRAFHASSRKMTVHNIESVEAWKEALANNKVVMLDCFATWCGPCKAIAPLLAKHSNDDQFKDIFFAKIDVDQLPDVAADLAIRAMPTFKVFKDGEMVDELVGASPPALQALLVKAASPAEASA